MGVAGSKSDFLMDGFCDKKYETVKGQLFLERVLTKSLVKYNDYDYIHIGRYRVFSKNKMSNYFQLNFFFIIVIIFL